MVIFPYLFAFCPHVPIIKISEAQPESLPTHCFLFICSCQSSPPCVYSTETTSHTVLIQQPGPVLDDEDHRHE